MIFDDLATATEEFIHNSVENHFAEPHSADVERLKALKTMENKQETEKPHPAKPPKSHSKKQQEPKIVEKEIPKPEPETAAVAPVSDESQGSSQKRRKRKHHHQEEQQE